MRVPRSTSAHLFPACLVLLAGCSLPPGTTFFPGGQRLLRSTKDLVQPIPPDLPRELDKQPMPAYTVEPGDVLLIQPADLDSPIRLPGDQPILPDGTIQLGRYGPLLVAGRTLSEIESMVKAAVEARTKDAGVITVRLVNRQSKVYYVLGEVHAPGAFPLIGRETVLDGILAAGGLNDRAARNHIILSRPTAPDSCRIVLPVCFQEIVQHGDTATNYQLLPGDRIYVPSGCFMDDFMASFKKDAWNCPPPPRHGPPSAETPCDDSAH